MGNKKRQKKQKKVADKQKLEQFKFSTWHKNLLAISILILFILFYYADFIFFDLQPAASDTFTWRGNAQSLIEARQKGEANPLWANNLFCGMPATMVSIVAPFQQPAKYLLKGFREIIDFRALYLFLGGLGIFLIMRLWNFSPLVGFISAMIFILWPQLSGLLEAGHNTKFNTMMLAPLSLYLYLRFIKKPNLLHMSLFVILFSLNIQERHIQIIFYLGLLMLAFTITELINLLKKKEYRPTISCLIYLVVAFSLAIGVASFPTLMINEYAKYSIRGGSEYEKNEGLDYDYATGWSLHPKEMITFLIPRFYGGDSQEHYEGKAVPELKGRTIPGYWGYKPFTTSSDYLGIIALVLALYGGILLWKDGNVLTLIIVAITSIIIAFGNFFPLLYDIFFNLVPFFNKFRVPSMILFLVQICVAFLAGFGFNHISEHIREDGWDKQFLRITWILFAILLIIGFVPFLFKDSFNFVKPNEVTNYRPDVLNLLKEVRYDLMKQDAIRMLVLSAALLVLLLSYSKKWISKTIFAGVIILLIVIDLVSINRREMKNMIKETRIEQQFAANPTDKFLQKDSSLYRIFPLGRLYDNSHWSYRHQSIGGYHPAKLRLIQDINESCLYQGREEGFQNQTIPINWNIVNMFNVRYILAQNTIDHPNLNQVFSDNQSGIKVYENRALLDRVYPVGKIEIIKDKNDRLARLNDPNFDPASSAILEMEPSDILEGYPTHFKYKMTRYEPNFVEFDITTEQQTLVVLSEMYYPAGWTADVDGQPVEIYKTNHALRSIMVAPGKHHIKFEYRPKTYVASLWIMGISILISYLVLLISVFFYLKKQPFQITKK